MEEKNILKVLPDLSFVRHNQRDSQITYKVDGSYGDIAEIRIFPKPFRHLNVKDMDSIQLDIGGNHPFHDNGILTDEKPLQQLLKNKKFPFVLAKSVWLKTLGVQVGHHFFSAENPFPLRHCQFHLMRIWTPLHFPQFYDILVTFVKHKEMKEVLSILAFPSLYQYDISKTYDIVLRFGLQGPYIQTEDIDEVHRNILIEKKNNRTLTAEDVPFLLQHRVEEIWISRENSSREPRSFDCFLKNMEDKETSQSMFQINQEDLPLADRRKLSRFGEIVEIRILSEQKIFDHWGWKKEFDVNPFSFLHHQIVLTSPQGLFSIFTFRKNHLEFYRGLCVPIYCA